MSLNSRTVLAIYIVLSIATAIYQAAIFSVGDEAGLQLQIVFAIVSLSLLIVWIELDCREQKKFYRPFEFGFLLLVFWPLYFPYYLFRTRGAYAVVWLACFVGLSCLGYALEWIVYLAR